MLAVQWQQQIIPLPLCKPQFQRAYSNGYRVKLAHPKDICRLFFFLMEICLGSHFQTEHWIRA